MPPGPGRQGSADPAAKDGAPAAGSVGSVGSSGQAAVTVLEATPCPSRNDPGGGGRSEREQVRVRDDQPFAAGRLEVDLHPGVAPLSFVRQHDAFAELRMPDPLSEP